MNDKERKYFETVEDFFRDYIFVELPEDVPCWIAGGALRDFYDYGYIKDDSDIDIFTDTPEHFNKLREAISEFYDEVIESDTALTFANKEDNEKVIQLIKLLYNNPVECINAFDFTACCAYVGYHPQNKNQDGIYSLMNDAAKEFFEDIDNKELRIIQLNNNPGITFSRLKKYQNKGYKISDEEKLSMINGYLQEDFQIDEILMEYEGLMSSNRK